jgi:hypothetical protein
MESAAAKVFPGRLQALRRVWLEVDGYLTSAGMSRDVKTVYVSYTSPHGHIVAAAHPDGPNNRLEVALALELGASPLLSDAVHLKWRHLPTAVVLESDAELTDELKGLLDAAVQNAGEVAPRPTEEFSRFAKRRAQRQQTQEPQG